MADFFHFFYCLDLLYGSGDAFYNRLALLEEKLKIKYQGGFPFDPDRPLFMAPGFLFCGRTKKTSMKNTTSTMRCSRRANHQSRCQGPGVCRFSPVVARHYRMAQPMILTFMRGPKALVGALGSGAGAERRRQYRDGRRTGKIHFRGPGAIVR